MRQYRIYPFSLSLFEESTAELYIPGCKEIEILRSDLTGMYPIVATMLNEQSKWEAHEYTLSGLCRLDVNNNRTLQLRKEREMLPYSPEVNEALEREYIRYLEKEGLRTPPCRYPDCKELSWASTLYCRTHFFGLGQKRERVSQYSTYYCISYKVSEDSLGPDEHIARRTTRTLYPTEEMAQANCKSWNKKSDTRVHEIKIPIEPSPF